MVLTVSLPTMSRKPHHGRGILSQVTLCRGLVIPEDFSGFEIYFHAFSSTLWLFNIAMEHGPFIVDLPIKNGDFP